MFLGKSFFDILFYFILLYNTVLVLPYSDMNPPWVYMSSQSWTPLPPPSPYHLSGSARLPRCFGCGEEIVTAHAYLIRLWWKWTQPECRRGQRGACCLLCHQTSRAPCTFLKPHGLSVHFSNLTGSLYISGAAPHGLFSLRENCDYFLWGWGLGKSIG